MNNITKRILYKRYVITYFKIFAIFYFLGIFMGSVDWLGLLWRIGLFSIIMIGFIYICHRYNLTGSNQKLANILQGKNEDN